MATTPANTITTEITTANTGRSMKKRAITVFDLWPCSLIREQFADVRKNGRVAFIGRLI